MTDQPGDSGTPRRDWIGPWSLNRLMGRWVRPYRYEHIIERDGRTVRCCFAHGIEVGSSFHDGGEPRS